MLGTLAPSPAGCCCLVDLLWVLLLVPPTGPRGGGPPPAGVCVVFGWFMGVGGGWWARRPGGDCSVSRPVTGLDGPRPAGWVMGCNGVLGVCWWVLFTKGGVAVCPTWRLVESPPPKCRAVWGDVHNNKRHTRERETQRGKEAQERGKREREWCKLRCKRRARATRRRRP